MLATVKQCFRKEVAKKEAELNLAYAGLLMSEYLTEAFEITLYLTLLDEIAETAQGAIVAAETGLQKIRALNHHLFDELKFTGNDKRYYHPDNSFLNKVLDSRTGIPISLSVIYLEVGWRLGMPLWGIGLPNHFIVGNGLADDAIYIDVFNRGRILSQGDCLELARVPLSKAESFRETFLKPATKKSILYRMLLNLKQIYVGLEEWNATYNTVDLMLVVRPDQTGEIRDRGLIAYRLDRLQAAILDIERYLFLMPNSPDAAWLKDHLTLMEDKLMRLN